SSSRSYGGRMLERVQAGAHPRIDVLYELRHVGAVDGRVGESAVLEPVSVVPATADIDQFTALALRAERDEAEAARPDAGKVHHIGEVVRYQGQPGGRRSMTNNLEHITLLIAAVRLDRHQVDRVQPKHLRVAGTAQQKRHHRFEQPNPGRRRLRVEPE